jgi:RND family efflux transporter MFP subunit
MLVMGFQRTVFEQASILALAAALLALAACRPAQPAEAQSAGPPAVPVQVTELRPTPVADTSEYLGTVLSLSSTTVKPEVNGALTRIYVRSGDRVAVGAPLFQIDPRVQEAAVSSQDAALAAQRATVTYAEQQLERSKTLLGVGAISQQEFDQANSNYENSRSQLQSLEARLHEERVTLQYYDVKAPTPGIVGDIPVRVGMHVTSDTVLTTVDRNADLEVDVQVPLERAAGLRPGLPLEIFDNDGNLLAGTSLSYVSPRVNDQTQSVLVKGRVSGALRSQQFVRARITWKTEDRLVVPFLAVVRVNGQPFVFVAAEQDGRLVAEQRPVQLGRLVGNDFLVTGGVRPGDRIVVSGVQKLANGAAIRAS